jgi:O-antigen/teichoic acid export membrane protein
MIYQVFVLLVPLITIPYISRVLGSHGVGVNAFTNSVIQYFILFGTIGVALYGNRTIAYKRDNKEELSRTFWSIFLLKLITTGLAYIAFLIFMLFVNNYQPIYLIQSIYIISAAFDITWLFMGLEDFKKTVLRNILVKTIGAISIFVFIRTGSDLWKYVMILSMSELIGQLTMWFYLPRTVNRLKVKWRDIRIHFLPAISLFLPQVAIQIYAVLNKNMLGILANTNEVGYFDNADKIIKMVLAVVTAMGVVMLPRVSNMFARGDTKKVKEYLNQSLDFASYLSIPMMFGLAGMALKFAPWFFGIEFYQTGVLMAIISPIVVLIAWSNVVGIQYLMPTGKMRAFTISVTAGAIVNFIFNLILIRPFQSVGTGIATVIAEVTVTFVQLCFIWKDINVSMLCKSLLKYVAAGMLTCVVAQLIGIIMHSGAMMIAAQIIAGAVVYFLMLFVLRSQMNQKIFSMGLKIIRKVRNR